MSFDKFLDQAWTDHATSAEDVAARLPDAIAMIDDGAQIPLWANLVTHVFGEHLARWTDGIELLKRVTSSPMFDAKSESGSAIRRSIACLELASGQRTAMDDFSPSDQIRILAVAASALAEQKNTAQAQAFFKSALEQAQTNLASDDPANRALAVTGNNLACALEEKTNRTTGETELMILAAQAARKFWQLAGTWLHVERAEYRLSRTYLQAGDPMSSLRHAQTCLEICQANEAPALERFFGYQALGLAESASGNQIGFGTAVQQASALFEALTDDEKSWCRVALEKLNASSVSST